METGRRMAKTGAARPDDPGELVDLRFRTLLGADQWEALPHPVQRRFSKRLLPGHSVTYTGAVVHCSMSAVGWVLAQLCRLIKAPLPLDRGGGTAAVVTVTEDARGGGQVWTRMYARRSAFPQVIHSAKRFAGPTGLEEYLGCGFGIALHAVASAQGLAFLSDHYFVRIAGRRLAIPLWLSPGRLRIDHIDRGEGRFDFGLTLDHPLLGRLIHQLARFCDQPGAGELQ